MTDDNGEKKATKKATPNMGHIITIGLESNDSGEDQLVVRCDNCGYAQAVPGNSDAEAQLMAVNHQK